MANQVGTFNNKQLPQLPRMRGQTDPQTKCIKKRDSTIGGLSISGEVVSCFKLTADMLPRHKMPT